MRTGKMSCETYSGETQLFQAQSRNLGISLGHLLILNCTSALFALASGSDACMVQGFFQDNQAPRGIALHPCIRTVAPSCSKRVSAPVAPDLALASSLESLQRGELFTRPLLTSPGAPSCASLPLRPEVRWAEVVRCIWRPILLSFVHSMPAAPTFNFLGLDRSCILVLVPATTGKANREGVRENAFKYDRQVSKAWGLKKQKHPAKCEVYCAHVLSKVGVLGKGSAGAQLDQYPDGGNMSSSLQKEP